MVLAALPGWVVDDEESVRAEMAAYRDATPAELWRHTEDCARDAMWALRASDVRARALAHTDPVPESTVRALERLRAECP